MFLFSRLHSLSLHIVVIQIINQVFLNLNDGIDHDQVIQQHFEK